MKNRFLPDENGKPVLHEVPVKMVSNHDVAKILMKHYGDLHNIWDDFKKIGVEHLGYDADSEVFD